MIALIIIEAAALLLLAMLVGGLLRSHAEILRKLHALGAGLEEPADGLPRPVAVGVPEPRTADGPAVDVSGELADGGAATIAVVGVDRFTLLAFLSSGCATCAAFWEEFRADGDLALPGTDARLVIVTKGRDAESPARVASLAPTHHQTVMSSQAWDDYDVPVSPYFIMVDGTTGRVVGEGAATNWPQVSSLMRQAMADTATLPSRLNGPSREARADETLAAAGIEAGHPSLYPGGAPESGS